MWTYCRWKLLCYVCRHGFNSAILAWLTYYSNNYAFHVCSRFSYYVTIIIIIISIIIIIIKMYLFK